jgi:hypothetical protein
VNQFFTDLTTAANFLQDLAIQTGNTIQELNAQGLIALEIFIAA